MPKEFPAIKSGLKLAVDHNSIGQIIAVDPQFMVWCNGTAVPP